MYLLVGLGNPDDKYRNNRHNIGFMVVEAVAEEYDFPAFQSKFHGKFSSLQVEGQKLSLLMPGTYMNASGRAVQAAMAFFKLPPEQVIVVHDDIDLPAGELRIKQGGGHGGHNGLRDIDATIGKNYWRLRIGVGHPGDKERVVGHVLSDFAQSDWPWVNEVCGQIAVNLPQFWQDSPADFLQAVKQHLKIKDTKNDGI